MPDEPELTEILDADVERVDGVRGPANGMPFLMLKSAGDQPEPTALTEVAKASADQLPATDAAAAAADQAPAAPVEKQVDGGEPGSPAWEAQDAAALRTIAAQLADLKVRLEAAADRERAEVAEGDVDDLADAWDLDDAVSCLTAALGVVARLAFTEQQEALRPDGAVAKAGRRLSAKSVVAIETVRAQLAELLGVAPDMPATEDTTEGATEVTKTEIEQILDAKLAPLAKALSERGAVTKEAATAPPPADAPPQASAEQPAASAPAATPQADPAAAAPPAEPVEKATPKDETADVSALLKSVVAEAIEAAVKPLKESVARMEQQPMPGGPFLRGAGVPQADYLVTRGQAQSTATFGSPEAVTKALEEISDPHERDRVGRQLAQAMHPYAGAART